MEPRIQYAKTEDGVAIRLANAYRYEEIQAPVRAT